MTLSPITRRRLAIFRQNRRGFVSLWIFAALFFLSLFAEFIANDRPLLIRYDGHWFVPVLQDYSEDAFGPDFLPTEADYTDPELAKTINARGWMIWPLVPYSYNTVVKNLTVPAPAPPSWRNPFGTDDQARDVLARVIYGFRLSVLFGFTLTIISSVIGVAAGAVQGYYGGTLDLLFQRFIEIWSGMPELYLLIILGSVLTPSFWVLLIFLRLVWLQVVEHTRYRIRAEHQHTVVVPIEPIRGNRCLANEVPTPSAVTDPSTARKGKECLKRRYSMCANGSGCARPQAIHRGDRRRPADRL